MAIFDVPLDVLRQRTSVKWRRFEPDVLPMFVAEMDARLSPAVAQRLRHIIEIGDTGYPEQRDYEEAFARFAAGRWGWDLPVDLIRPCGDVMGGMEALVLALTQPGDAVVINPPIYPPFRGVLGETGRSALEAPLTPAGRLDLDVLRSAFAGELGPRPTAYLLCSPHNPNGTIHTRDELAAVGALAGEHGVRVIVDEIHAPLTHAGEHVPYVTVPGCEDGFIVTSASKAWNLAGLKAALIVAGPAARHDVEQLSGELKYKMSHVGALAHACALDDDRAWLDQCVAELDVNKRLFADLLAEQLPEAAYAPAPGTYLAWVDCSGLGLEHPGRTFHEDARVRFNLGPEFATDAQQFVRVNLATSPEIIAEAVRRMASVRR